MVSLLIVGAGFTLALGIVVVLKAPKPKRADIAVRFIFAVMSLLLVYFFVTNFKKIDQNQYVLLALASVLYREINRDVKSILSSVRG